MQNRDAERRPIWERIRRHYKSNLLVALPDDEERVKAEYKAAKTKQYRKQFKEDYPEFEAQIDGDDYYEKLAREDIKQIIRPFYPTPITAGFIRGLSPEQIQHFFGTALVIFGTATALASYDACKILLYRDKPSVVINLLGVGIMAYALQREAPKDTIKKLILNDYIEAGFHYHKGNERLHPNDRRSLPNYKTRLANEKTTDERNH